MYSVSKGKGFFSGSAVYLISNVFSASIPLILIPILTRFLDPVSYGEVAMFQTLVVGLAAFVGLSVHGAANRKYYDDNLQGAEFACYVGSCIQVLVFSTCVVLIIMFFSHNWFSSWLGLSVEWLFWAVVVSALGFVVNMRLGQWQVRKQAGKYGLLQVSQSVGGLIFSLLFVVILLRGAEGRMEAIVLSCTIFAAVALYLLHKDGLIVFFAWRPGFIKEQLSYGVPLMPHVIGAFLLFFVDRFIINAKLGLAQAGIYMLAVQLSLVLGLIFDAVNKAYVPWLFERLQRGERNEKQKLVVGTYIYFFVLVLIAVLSFFIGPFAVGLIAGQQYSSAGAFIGWLILGQSFKGMYMMVAGYIYYSKRTGLLSLITINSGLVNFALLFLGVGLFGLAGAAMAFAIAMALQFALAWVVAARLYPMPWLQVFWRIDSEIS